ncbi:MAG TPA: hypothetical protein VEB64_13950 [Azospirillaceae bacterium]|nr:hypothetical protein [Azospirillaceae bacterium]
MLRKFSFFAILLLGLLGAAPGHAADPTPERLRDQLAPRLPALWKLKSLTVLGHESSGNQGDATVVSRFQAVVSLNEHLYIGDGYEGPVSFVRRYADAGTEKVLLGTARSVPQKDTWSSQFELSNEAAVTMPATPLSMFPGRVIIRGTEDEASYYTQRQAETAARHTAELAVLEEQTQFKTAERAQLEKQEAERAKRLSALRESFQGNDRAARIAAIETALWSSDGAVRTLAFETAYASKDPAIINIAMRAFFGQIRTPIPVAVYATKEDPNSQAAVDAMGPFTVTVTQVEQTTGILHGRIGAPGYPVTQPADSVGLLAQTEVTIVSPGCALALRLSDAQAMDGLLRCQSLPPLIARIALQ